MFVQLKIIMKSFTSILFLAITFSLSTLHAQTADQVIEGYVKFIGGEKNWAKVKTIITSGEYNYGGAAFPFTATAKAPNLYKFIVPFNGKYYAQAFDGTKGWKIDAFKNETEPTLLTGKPALAMANEADVELEDALINYMIKGHQATLEGTELQENKECFKVNFTRKTGEIETYFFDVKNYSLIMKRAVSKNIELEASLLSTFYSDYRDVKGIKIPFKAISEANGQTILTITIEKVELNKPVADSEFQPNN